jgi:hypothetical protein
MRSDRSKATTTRGCRTPRSSHRRPDNPGTFRAPPSLNIGEHTGRDSPPGKGCAEAVHHIGAGGVAAGITDHTQPGVVVENVQDRDLGAISQLPMSDIGCQRSLG